MLLLIYSEQNKSYVKYYYRSLFVKGHQTNPHIFNYKAHQNSY